MGANYDNATCVDCKTIRRVYHREWIRAAAPRCRACGGRVEKSEASAKEHLVHSDAKREQQSLLNQKKGIQ